MRFRNVHATQPDDVQDGDAFPFKIVAVAGQNNDWSAYWGPSSWSDERVAQEGDKLSETQARPLFYVLTRSGREYRP